MMFKAKRIEHAIDGRELTEEELIDWIQRDGGLIFKMEGDTLFVCEATHYSIVLPGEEDGPHQD